MNVFITFYLLLGIMTTLSDSVCIATYIFDVYTDLTYIVWRCSHPSLCMWPRVTVSLNRLDMTLTKVVHHKKSWHRA